MIERWDELVALYQEEAGTDAAPVTYDLMLRLRALGVSP